VKLQVIDAMTAGVNLIQEKARLILSFPVFGLLMISIRHSSH
jgi:hypothetical protein